MQSRGGRLNDADQEQKGRDYKGDAGDAAQCCVSCTGMIAPTAIRSGSATLIAAVPSKLPLQMGREGRSRDPGADPNKWLDPAAPVFRVAVFYRMWSIRLKCSPVCLRDCGCCLRGMAPQSAKEGAVARCGKAKRIKRNIKTAAR